MTTLRDVRAEVSSSANPQKAKVLARFFKTGPGEYAQGDIFVGLMVPQIHKLSKQYAKLPIADVIKLLHSPIHEERLIALDIMVLQFEKGDEELKHRIYTKYLDNTKYINNWDLIDLTSDKIIGAYLENKKKDVLVSLAKSKSIWQRRIAMLATFHYIKKGESKDALKIADILVYDSHDLIRKAVGWMLREIGKRCSIEEEEVFLKKYAATMPRTMLRYAIERFPETKKRLYMHMKSVREKNGGR